MKIFLVLVCVMVSALAVPRPDDDEEYEEDDDDIPPDVPPVDTTPPDGKNPHNKDKHGLDETNESDDIGSGGIGSGGIGGGGIERDSFETYEYPTVTKSKRTTKGNKIHGQWKPGGEQFQLVPSEEEGNDGEGEKCVTKAQLRIPGEEAPPMHAVTNVYGEALKIHERIKHNIGRNQKININTEKWLTEHTPPPTKPNCRCLTRGPLSKFKLIGNIHFRHLKVPPQHPSKTSTDGSATVCPPCNCADCFTTQTIKKRDKVC